MTVVLRKEEQFLLVIRTYDVGENADLAGGLVYRGPDIRGGMEGQKDSHCEYLRAFAVGERDRPR